MNPAILFSMLGATLNRLRFKSIFMILPLVVVIIILDGVFAGLESQTAITELANRHLTYKAEQLRDFINNEWDVIENLKLGDQVEYRDASRESFNSYAYSLLRNKSELILVVDNDHVLVSGIGMIADLGPLVPHHQPACGPALKRMVFVQDFWRRPCRHRFSVRTVLAGQSYCRSCAPNTSLRSGRY